MKSLSGKQLCRLLEARGWVLKRITGSHHIDAKAGSPARLSISVHANAALKLGLQRHLMDRADIDESEL